VTNSYRELCNYDCVWLVILQVSLSNYSSYAKAMGIFMSAVLLAMFFLAQAASIWSSIWLSNWTDDPLLKNTSLVNTSLYLNRQYYYLGVYSGLNGAQGMEWYVNVIMHLLHVSAIGNQIITFYYYIFPIYYYIVRLVLSSDRSATQNIPLTKNAVPQLACFEFWLQSALRSVLCGFYTNWLFFLY